MASHHVHELHEAQNLLRDAADFLQDLPDGRVPLTDLVKELLHHRPETTFLQTNLVSDGFVPAVQTDPNLINPWGMSSSTTSPIWISDNGTGLASIYGVSDGTVTVNRILPVTIAPATPGGDPAAPTGQVFNAFQADNAFMLRDGQPANFLFATEDGTISGWNPGAGTQSIITVTSRSTHRQVTRCWGWVRSTRDWPSARPTKDRCSMRQTSATAPWTCLTPDSTM
jgi:hypothetical protein